MKLCNMCKQFYKIVCAIPEMAAPISSVVSELDAAARVETASRVETSVSSSSELKTTGPDGEEYRFFLGRPTLLLFLCSQCQCPPQNTIGRT